MTDGIYSQNMPILNAKFTHKNNVLSACANQT